jgi:phospholipid/cholesterol/gamma-HCH transport system substrate-binding protein
MSERALRFRVGLFVLVALVLLAALTVLFSGFPTLLKPHVNYAVLFPSVDGVDSGTPVRRSGVPIGEVRSVQLDDETGRVRVGIVVEQGHALRKNDQPTLVHGLLGGDAAIDLVARPATAPDDREPLPPGSEVAGVLGADTLALLNQTTELVPSTQQTLNEMRKSMQRFERMAPQLEDSIREYRDLARAAREMIPELRRTNDEVQVTARNWGRLGERMDVLLQTNQDKLVQGLDNFNETVKRVGNAFSAENQRNLSASLANLQQATKPMAERGGSVMRNLDESTDRLNRTLYDAQLVLRAFNQGEGFRRFVADPALYNNLNDAACQLVHILPRVDRAMQDLEVFADKIARHPESLGLGGVVQPSSGLKEAPARSGHWPGGH